jgi:hypothetical protein
VRLLVDENFNQHIADGLIARDPRLDLVHVRDAGLAAADPTIFDWAAAQDRVLLTHDRQTIPGFAYVRVSAGRRMPGVFLVSDDMPVGLAIDEILLAAHCLSEDECEDRVRYFPMSGSTKGRIASHRLDRRGAPYHGRLIAVRSRIRSARRGGEKGRHPPR